MPPAVALTAAVLAGALLAAQARVNGTLAEQVGSGVVAALVSFGVGTVMWLVVLGVTGRWRRSGRLRYGTRGWWWFGGLGGAFLVTATAVAVPRIGVALTSVGIVAGSTVGGLTVDRLGIAPGGTHALTLARTGGSVLAVAGLIVATGGDNGEARPLLLALVATAGALTAAQQAANGHLRRHSGDAFVAAAVNFVVGLGAVGAVTVVLAASGALDRPDWPAQPVLYVGGLGGAAAIALSAALVAKLGVLKLSLGAVLGQLSGGLVIDALGGQGVRARTAIGAAVTLVAVLIATRGAKADEPGVASGATGR